MRFSRDIVTVGDVTPNDVIDDLGGWPVIRGTPTGGGGGEGHVISAVTAIVVV